MIPIRDTIPCLHRPYITWALIFINVTMFVGLFLIADEQHALFLYRYGMVAARYSYPDWGARIGLHPDGFLSFVTSMFLHGGWWHLLMNMIFLWIFADNIEDIMGKGRFIAFYFICGLLAVSLQFYFNPASTIPMVGASGAIDRKSVV